MATSVTVPNLGESITQAVLLRWTKNDGDRVAKDEVIAELETDKANVELTAPAGGVLTTKAKPGDTVKVGDVLAMLDENGAAAKIPAKAEARAEAASAAKPSGGGAGMTGSANPTPGVPTPGQSSSAETDESEQRPSVRRLVEENGLDIAAISGTGPGGKITKEDVLRHMDTKPAAADSKAESTPAAPRPAESKPPEQQSRATSQPGSRSLPATDESVGGYDEQGQKRVPMSKIRKRIAQTLVQAQQTAAILTTFNEVDMSQIMALRGKFKERFQEVHNIGLGFMSFFGKAVTLAIKEFPRVNARIDGDDVIYHDHVHLGIAVSTERGLAVPVLRNADQMGFAKIESEIKRLATAVRDGKLGLQELTGGTFSITNGGVFGSLLSTPILNPPQSAILGMHAIQQRPIAVDGRVEIRPMMYIALSYDHRLVDGRESVSFLVRLKQYLEDPARLMLEV